MKITIIGTGYVGLVSGVCFAKIGHHVICVDKDQDKISKLKNGQIPIFEPGLEEILDQSIKSNNINFTTSLQGALKDCDAIFIAVGTPQSENEGSANLQYVFEVAKDIAKYASSHAVIVTKSTVPVGTGHKIESLIKQENPALKFSIISNPEFLREGKAIDDFAKPDRVVVGYEDEKARKIMSQIYQPLCDSNNNPNLVIYTDVTTSELIKYAANSFLATKVAFINEMANLCEKVGANIQDLSHGIGSDTRIGNKFLNPGPGFGGSCFPKDILALNAIAKDNNVELSVIDAIISSNENRKMQMAQMIIAQLGGSVKNKVISFLGLAFKGDTDDIRYSPAIAIIKELLKAGAKIQAFDPQAIQNSKDEINQDNIIYCEDPYESAQNAQTLVIATEWDEFRDIDLSKLPSINTIIDLRNMLDRQKVESANIKYICIGSNN
jgi:UDPglucose 6-dehydrogenase